MIIKLNMRLFQVQKGYFKIALKLPSWLAMGWSLEGTCHWLSACPLLWAALSTPASITPLLLSLCAPALQPASPPSFMPRFPFAIIHLSFSFQDTPIPTYHLSSPSASFLFYHLISLSSLFFPALQQPWCLRAPQLEVFSLLIQNSFQLWV